MGIGFGAFILVGMALLVSLGGIAGLWGRRHRFARRAVAEAVCPACRYVAADPSRPCSECGADLARRGVVGADWPRRRDWLLRTVFVLMFVLPLPFVLGFSAQRLVPSLNHELVVTVIGVADDAGVPHERLMVMESRRWFSRGSSVNGAAPAAVAAEISFGVPPEDARRRITSDEGQDGPVQTGRAALGDQPYPRRSRDELDGAAARCLDLADAVITGGAAAASAAAGRTWASQGHAVAASLTAGTRGGERLEQGRWTYGSLVPDTVVPLARHLYRSRRVLTPHPEYVLLAAWILGGLLLARGWWLSRRFRPVPAPPADA